MQGMGDWLNSRRHFSANLLPLITAISLLLLFPSATLGAALTWVSTGADADFNIADNWSPAQQPTTSDSCTINSTSNRQPSILTTARCSSMTLWTDGTVMTLSSRATKNFRDSGYPQGLTGENIPIQSRIVTALDAYDAMTSERPYRSAPGRVWAIRELRKYRGTQFDPQVVEALLNALQQEQEIDV